MVTIVNRTPKTLGIIPILDAYIEHYNFKPVLLTDLINEYRNTGRITDMAIMNFDNYFV